ncbi:ELMO/CED-12 family-domain-containing protein [Gamsiella multidivaricata]|uniref:ELMO/CED-12 family-domain-containing protein n=1 Tax=Gamsiella multidivaricata TaxID=101098 RepID=UPI00221F1CD6|nr:ELMO/CED-12 family-domain-containing protein [Gamsiella multidivaricata]KAG0356358.1 hypothetical protein BGZ54_000759 [Gamsiella multidivaricata]KAI7825726.1 ELMO/CED-12 family-domain-containing protein [Gamsiella multidivaricata]
MAPPSSKRTAIASVKYHVQQWVNLVLDNSIYQNLVLLYLYRVFKFIYGLFNKSTELSRICGANNWPTPLDALWDDDGNVTSSLVNEKNLGTIAYSSAATAVHLHVRSHTGLGPAGWGRRGSMQSGQNTASSAAAVTGTTAARRTIRTSDDSERSTQSFHDSGTDVEERNLVHSSGLFMPSSVTTTVEDSQELSSSSTTSLVDDHATELRHRKKRSVSMASSISSSNSLADRTKMDLRQSRAAAGMVYRIDRCILFSKQLTLERRELEAAECDPVQIIHQILRKKRFPDGGSPNTPAARKLQYALEKVASTHQLAREINQRAHTKYDSTNPAHERKLMLLWDLLQPQEKLKSRYTKQWTEIGFQGKDPATDFRGMGMLGLDDLIYYARYYPQSARHALECSHDEKSWYSFAIVGINITAFAVQTLRTRQLQYFLFLNGTDRSIYHELYCYLFHRFNGYWTTLDPKPSIMDFERVFADFKIMMERQLARRKLMMMRYDTKESLDDQHLRRGPAEEKSSDGEAVELETKKAK